MFRKYIWEQAYSVCFLFGRLKFYHANGEQGKDSAGAPSVLVAWNETGHSRLLKLDKSGLGKIVSLGRK